MNLLNEFVRSFIRQIGRDGGKVISNKVYKGKHGTPIYNSGNSNNKVVYKEKEVDDINWNIQPSIKKNLLWILIKGVLIQFIPLIGFIWWIAETVTCFTKKTTYIYKEVEGYMPDKRYKDGYKQVSNKVMATKNIRILTNKERKELRMQGFMWILSFVVFYVLITYII